MRFATCYRRADLRLQFRSLPLDAVTVDHVRRRRPEDRRRLEVFVDDDGSVKELADAGEPHRFPLVEHRPTREALEAMANGAAGYWLPVVLHRGATMTVLPPAAGLGDEGDGW